MRIPIVAANWKLNGSTELCELYAAELTPSVKVDVWVFPTAIHLASLVTKVRDKGFRVGAQNVYSEEVGPFTGETSAMIVASAGGSCVIVGHSERRTLFEETDEAVAEKFAVACTSGLNPILCIGEFLPERENGKANSVIQRQLEAVLERTGVAAFKDAVIAYEPVWAIGTGVSATPKQAEEMHAFIRELIAAENKATAADIRILYGGSVNSNNAAELIEQPNIDGYLVGGASLDIAEFSRICDIAKR